ncbi:MAG: glucose-1-phosphate cytidylyltransferase [Patescibacteria group bacterium]|jgi:glucose-1-phosphate cytidylyltransferase
MKAVILCGGKGTRLREETEHKPKPLVPIGGMPILWHIMKIYSQYGIKDFVLCLGYKGEMIRDYFLNFEEMAHDFTLDLRATNGSRLIHHNQQGLEDWRITFVDTGQEANTGARIAKIEPYVRGETFCLTYGDGVANIDINKLVAFHKEQGMPLTLTGIHPESVYGIIEHEEGKAKSFKEKPRTDTTINGGFFVCEPEIFKYLSTDDSCVFEQDPMRALAAEGRLAVYDHKDFWYCMDTYKHYEILNERWNKGQADWKMWS